jgi:hypothetical protein
MLNKALPYSLITTMFASLPFYVTGSEMTRVKSISDRLYDNSLRQYQQQQPDSDPIQFCETEETAVITIYSEDGSAQLEIDVKVDGSPVGTLATYYPDEPPECKTPSNEGIITLIIPAGEHTIEATSPNLAWPAQSFRIDKCRCMLMPLS